MAAAPSAAATVKRGNLPRNFQEQRLSVDSSLGRWPLFHSSPKKRNARGFRATDRGGERGEAPASVRPRIRQDLLPHDFAEWSSAPNGSVLPSVESRPGRSLADAFGRGSSAILCRSGNVGSGAARRAGISRRRASCDGFEEGLRGAEELVNRSSDFRAMESSMEEWSGLPPCGTIDKTIYQNLVEMIPLMESFMEQKGRRAFTRHASMVYTPAPSRDVSVKKVAESPLKSSSKNKQQKPANGKVESKEDGSPMWDEQENILRRVDSGPECNEAQRQMEKLNKEELVQLQSQIDLLKKQVWEKDNMLESVRSLEAAETAREEEVLLLKKQMGDMQKTLWERERVVHAVQLQLSEKQKELVNMETLAERMQREVMKKNDAAARMRDELSQLQLQFSAAQFQAQLPSIRLDYEADTDGEALKDDATDTSLAELVLPCESMPEKESRKLETARRMYLGAVITARQKPGAESIALAAALRKRLEGFLTHHPYLCGGESGSLRSQDLGLPLI